MRTTIPYLRKQGYIRWQQFLQLFVVGLLWFGQSNVMAADQWQLLRPGIAYQDLAAATLSRWSHIHIFRINLAYNRFELSINTKHPSFVDDFARKNHALIALNGGFFDERNHSLGLRVSQHTEINPAKTISWWGIFYIQNNQAHIVNQSHYPRGGHIDFAVQAGPRLVINNRIPSLKPGYAERSALGITRAGEIIILVTENAPMSTYATAELLKNNLDCPNALNLDGGSSSQLYALIDNFKILAPNFAQISDAILVKSR